MNRRFFLRSLVGGVAAAAAVRTFPLRVFSFPQLVIGRRAFPNGDLLFLESRAFQSREVCTQFRVPPELLQVGLRGESFVSTMLREVEVEEEHFLSPKFSRRWASRRIQPWESSM